MSRKLLITSTILLSVGLMSGAWLHGYNTARKAGTAREVKILETTVKEMNKERERRDIVKQQMRKVVGNAEGYLDDDFYIALDCLHDIRRGEACVSAFTTLAGKD